MIDNLIFKDSLETYGSINKHPAPQFNSGVASYTFQVNTLPKVYGALEIHLDQVNRFIIEKNDFPLIVYTHEQFLFLEKALASAFYLDVKWQKEFMKVTFRAIAHSLKELIQLIITITNTLKNLID